ncbi:MAG: hypothetical protein M3291_08005 [Actinomycetota bacterium]|nr:hypothetical protein [Actinomycetota bacterium]
MAEITETAGRLAATQPEATMPCPLCAASVKGANLDRHLGKVHPGHMTGPRSAERSWRGPERLIARPLVIVPILAVLGSLTLISVTGEVDQALVFGSGGALSIGLILTYFVLEDAPLFRGRLSVQGESLVLSHTLGLRRRRLARVDRVETGSAYDVRSSSSGGDGTGGQTTEEPVGMYLKLHGGRRHITVRCKQSAGFRKTWTGWEQAARSRRWHITLAPADFVALQYILSELGILTLRTR